MTQILNRYSFGSDLGSALGSGLGQGLSYLAQNKIGKMTKANEISNYSNLLKNSGLDSRDADVLAYHAVNNPDQYHHILNQYSPRQAVQDIQSEQPQYQQALQHLDQPQYQNQNQQFQPQQQQFRQPTVEQEIQLVNLLKGLGNPQKQKSGLGEGVDLLQQNAANQLLKTAVQKPEEERRIPEKKAIQKEQAKEEAKQVVKELKNPTVKQEAERISEQPHPLLAAKTKAQQLMNQKAEAEEKKEQQAINKSEKPYIDKVTAYKESADDADKRLNKMEKLIKKGNLPYSGFYNILKGLEHITPLSGAGAGTAIGGALGLAGGPLAPASATVGAAIGGGLGSLISPVVDVLKSFQRGVTATDTEEFEKLSNDFVKNAKTIFGSRITDADLKAFMATVPTLSQTDAGKLAIINNMKSFNKAAQVRYKAMRDIIRENGNKIPADLEFLVQDRVGPALDALSQEFVD